MIKVDQNFLRFLAVQATGFQELAVHVKNLLGAASLMEIVNILRHENDLTIERLLQSRQSQMAPIWFDASEKPLPALIIKPLHQDRVTGKALGRSDIFDSMPFPQTINPTKGLNPGLRRDACSGEDDDGPTHFLARFFHR